MQISKNIEIFLKLCDDCKKKYDIYFELVSKCDKKTTDYLHALELDNTPYNERAKMTTAQKRNLLERRGYKDIVEECAPLKEYLDDTANMKAINFLKQVLGQVRKIESYHKNRIYKKRYKEG